MAVTLICSSVSALAIPDLICREAHLVQVNSKSLQTQVSESSTDYRFKSGKLYLAPQDRAEYLYNEVVEVEPMRYTSGHKIIQFEAIGTEFRNALLVHAHRDEVRVFKASCKRI